MLMAVGSLSAASTGLRSAGASPLSSSFVPKSERFATSQKWKSSISSGRVSSAGVLFGARCRVAELEAPKETRSLYAVLGLQQNVGLSEIKISYRKLARRYHPDVCQADKGEECMKMFMEVQDAYETLSDPERRAKYDYQLMNPLGPGSVGWGSVVRRSKKGDNHSSTWRPSWEEQLAMFVKKEKPADTWGAKMRAKHAQSREQNV